MRILHIIHHFVPESVAGTEQYVLRVARQQQALGHNVAVLTRKIGQVTPEPGLQQIEVEGIPVIQINEPTFYMDAWYHLENPAVEGLLVQAIMELQPELVHLHHWLALSPKIVRFCKGLRLAVVVTLHDLYTSCPTSHRMHVDGYFCEQTTALETCRRCLLATLPQATQMDETEMDFRLTRRQNLLARELRMADQVVVGSQALWDQIRPAVVNGAKDAVLLPMFGSPHADVQPLQVSRDGFIRILYFGAMNRFKAPHQILEAAHGLPPALLPQLKFTFFGKIFDDDYRAQFERLSAGLAVRHVDRSFELQDLQDGPQDICVMPSTHFESFSFTANEVLLLGLPLILSDLGAPAERLAGEARIFKVNDIADLRANLLTLIQEPQQRAQLRKRAHARAAAFETVPEHVESLMDIYEQTLRGTRRPWPWLKSYLLSKRKILA
jgi:glycosyltransferase involved in cell wall biosynthesis